MPSKQQIESAGLCHDCGLNQQCLCGEGKCSRCLECDCIETTCDLCGSDRTCKVCNLIGDDGTLEERLAFCWACMNEEDE